ncbi:unnamed protein product [Rotaria magnacalcarata]
MELDNNCKSMINMINDIEQKQQRIFDMETKFENFFEKLILADDPSQLINELITDQSIEFNKVICCVLDHVAQIQSQRKIQYLAEIIGRTCFEKNVW